MVSGKSPMDWGADSDDNNYKSCFARSMAVNSQYKQLKGTEQLHPEEKHVLSSSFAKFPGEAPAQGVKLRKNSQTNAEDVRRYSCSSISSSRRASICSSRISEIPVENMVHQSRVSSLQWQLNEVEKSREMYKAVMKQVVTFLEKAHRSLELLGNRLNTKQAVPRSKSEHEIVTEPGARTLNNCEDYSMFRDYTWRRSKKEETTNKEEIPPEKLSQEAFRLLRTAQSLLNTQEPKLASTNDAPDDFEFMAQLAKEFPRPPDVKPQRTTSFSLSPKLLTPDKDIRISTAFNRKLSLQLNETRRGYKYTASSEFMSSTMNEQIGLPKPKFKHDSEKSNSPPAGSISSVEDESGFSSMNSFQDVGLPIVGEEVNAKNALLRSMLHNNVEYVTNVDEVKLWQKPDVAHKRWSSTPDTKQAMNVFWV